MKGDQLQSGDYHILFDRRRHQRQSSVTWGRKLHHQRRVLFCCALLSQCVVSAASVNPGGNGVAQWGSALKVLIRYSSKSPCPIEMCTVITDGHGRDDREQRWEAVEMKSRYEAWGESTRRTRMTCVGGISTDIRANQRSAPQLLNFYRRVWEDDFFPVWALIPISAWHLNVCLAKKLGEVRKKNKKRWGSWIELGVSEISGMQPRTELWVGFEWDKNHIVT